MSTVAPVRVPPLTSTVRLGLLGPVSVTVDGDDVVLPGPISRLLFVQLVLAGGRLVTDDAAIDAVWGTAPPESVAAALRVHVTNLRSRLRPVGVEILRKHHGYALGPVVTESDVDELARVEPVPATSDDKTLRMIETALALWRGPSVADLRALPLGGLLADGFDRRRQVLLDKQIEVRVRTGRISAALGDLDRMLADEPLNEHRWALMAEALYRSGQPAAALATLDRARRVLRDEAGLSPGPGLLAVQQAILHHSLAPTVTASAVEGAPTEVPLSLRVSASEKYVGRSAELAELTVWLTSILEQRLSSARSVIGEAGMGKSALAAELATRASELGYRVVHGSGDPDLRSPMSSLNEPFDTLLSLLRLTTTDAEHRRIADTLRADAGSRPDAASPDNPDHQRSAVIESARRLLAGIPEPLLLVVDDVQWVDGLSAAILRSVVRYSISSPLAVLLLSRSAIESPVGPVPAPPILLEPLTAQDIHPWLAHMAAPVSAPEILRMTDGIPLLIDHLMEGIRSGRPFPSVVESLGHRLLEERSRTLPRSTRRILEWAAVLGTTFSITELSDASGTPAVEVLEAVDEAIRAGILSLDLEVPSALRFRHALLRDAVSAAISPTDRARLHASVLTTVHSLTILGKAHHASHAQGLVPPTEFAVLVLAAAQSLIQDIGFEQAAGLIAVALQRCSGAIAPSLEAKLYILAARCAAAFGDESRSREHLSAAAAAANGATDDRIHLLAEIALAESRFGYRFRPDEAAVHQLTSLASELPADAANTRLALLREAILIIMSAGDSRSIGPLFDEAEQVAREIGTAEAITSLLSLQYVRWDIAGNRPGRREVARRATAVVAQARRPDRNAISTMGIAIIESLHDGDIRGAESLAGRMQSLAASLGEPYAEWLALAAGFTPPFLDGDLTSAAAAAERALRRGLETGNPGAVTAHAGHRFCLAWALGDFSSLAGTFDGLGGPPFVWKAATALTLVATGQFDRARTVTSSLAGYIAEGASDWLHFLGVALAVESACTVGPIPVLEACEAVLARRPDDHVVLGYGVADLGPVRRYLGLIHSVTGRRDQAVAELRQVRDDERSGKIWQIRAEKDLSTITGDNLGTNGALWAWVPPTALSGDDGLGRARRLR